jgi:predicted Ser/Thr protein kinase
MGEVYRATDTVLSRTVAVKVLADRHAHDEDVRTRFDREARAAARLTGEPNVITVYDVGEYRGRPFIVMEYIEGGSVYDRLREGPVEQPQALRWLSQAAHAVDAAHAHGVVHRDVKPANLLLDRDGNVHVSDFGIASAAGQDTLTLPGTVLGTVGYLAPEQARGEPATAASDRYALGVVAYELLVGRRPFAADTPAAELFAHLNADIPSAREDASELPVDVDDVLGWALAEQPSDRPQTCVQLVDRLNRAFDGDASPTLVEAGASTVRIPRKSRRLRLSARHLAVAGALGAIGLVTAALLSAAGGGDSPARTVTRVKTVVSTSASQVPASHAVTGATLNDEGFARMQAGDYAGALPLLERAVAALGGTGTLAEAYASYNLAATRFTLGRCAGVLDLLDRSEEIQGHRVEIDRLRAAAESACTSEPASGRGNAKGRKKHGTD